MRRDIQLLVPLVLFGLSFLAVLMGLLLLIGLKWDAVLEDVGLVEPSPTEVPIVRKMHAPNTRAGMDNFTSMAEVQKMG